MSKRDEAFKKVLAHLAVFSQPISNERYRSKIFEDPLQVRCLDDSKIEVTYTFKTVYDVPEGKKSYVATATEILTKESLTQYLEEEKPSE